MCTPAPARFLIFERLFTLTTISEPGTGYVDVKNEKNNGFLADVSLPPSSRAPRVSLAPKTPFPKAPFPFPFKRLLFCIMECPHIDLLVWVLHFLTSLRLWNGIVASIRILNSLTPILFFFYLVLLSFTSSIGLKLCNLKPFSLSMASECVSIWRGSLQIAYSYSKERLITC